MKNHIIYIFITGILLSCNNTPEETSPVAETNKSTVELTDAQSKNADIKTAQLQETSISEIIHVNGMIEAPPQNMVSVSVPMGGYLRTTKLLPGMHVKKGEIIASMEDQQYIELQESYLIAKAKMISIEAEYYRQSELRTNQATSDKVYKAAETEFMSQKIMIKSLAEKLKLIGVNPNNLNENSLSKSINIYSPIDGFVSKVDQNIGKYVSPTDVLFELINPEDIHLALTVFEKDLDKISIGQKVVAYNNINPDRKYLCEIILISKDVSAERTVEVHCHFKQYDKSLIPGMFMNAEIEESAHTAYVIPEDGLVRFEGKQYAFIIDKENSFEMKEVVAGNSANGLSQIRFADNTDIIEQTFVINGAYSLLMKMKNTEEE